MSSYTGQAPASQSGRGGNDSQGSDTQDNMDGSGSRGGARQSGGSAGNQTGSSGGGGPMRSNNHYGYRAQGPYGAFPGQYSKSGGRGAYSPRKDLGNRFPRL